MTGGRHKSNTWIKIDPVFAPGIYFIKGENKMKKLISTLLAVSAIALTGCSKGIKVNPDKEKYVVGIAQFAQHEALDAATKGFKDKLGALLKEESREVSFVETNSQGDPALCPTVVSDLVAKDVDLIMANATPVVSAAYSATTYIPILGTSVTDYGVAINATLTDGKTGANISGTSDLAPLDVQVNEMLKLLPDAKKVGIVYCSSEANSKFQVDEVSKLLKAKEITVNTHPFTDTNDLMSVCQKAASDNDAIYIPTDNTAAKSAPLINQVFEGAHIPVYAGEEGICKGAGIATLTIDYYHLGEITAEMAKNVLLGKEDIKSYAIKYDEKPVKKYSKARCEAFGITVPSDYVEL